MGELWQGGILIPLSSGRAWQHGLHGPSLTSHAGPHCVAWVRACLRPPTLREKAEGRKRRLPCLLSRKGDSLEGREIPGTSPIRTGERAGVANRWASVSRGRGENFLPCTWRDACLWLSGMGEPRACWGRRFLDLSHLPGTPAPPRATGAWQAGHGATPAIPASTGRRGHLSA